VPPLQFLSRFDALCCNPVLCPIPSRRGFVFSFLGPYDGFFFDAPPCTQVPAFYLPCFSHDPFSDFAPLVPKTPSAFLPGLFFTHSEALPPGAPPFWSLPPTLEASSLSVFLSLLRIIVDLLGRYLPAFLRFFLIVVLRVDSPLPAGRLGISFAPLYQPENRFLLSLSHHHPILSPFPSPQLISSLVLLLFSPNLSFPLAGVGSGWPH